MGRFWSGKRGIVFEMKKEMNTNTRDIEKYTQDYLKHDFEDVMVYYRRKKVLEVLNAYKPKKILEVGCGLKSLFEFYNEYDAFTVVEPSGTFCQAIQASSFFNNRVSLIRGFFEETIDGIKNKDFDFIVISSLLHEVINPALLLNSAHKLCKEKTVIHINVPNVESFHLLWAYESGLVPELGQLTDTALQFQQKTPFTLKTLSALSMACGFTVIEEGSYFVKPFNHTKMAQCMVGGIIDSRLLDGLYGLVKYFPKNGAEIYVNCKIRNGD
jgi:SAM-dependent methyltransferase